MNPRVSLCLPTYNRATLLAASLSRLRFALASHASAQDFEVCISDNASPDGTPGVIDEFASHESPWSFRRTRQQANLGFAGNFSAVIRLATGSSICIIADDDELLPDALDILWDASRQMSCECPLAFFATLPGGDAAARGMIPPATETAIAGPHELLARLGVFHASFITNMMFHRESAIDALTPACLQSRYPHTCIALSLLRGKPAVYYPVRLVRVHLPPDADDQPLLTCVDMARVQTDFALGDRRSRGLVFRVYGFLVRMLPTAVYLRRRGRGPAQSPNPFASLRLGNVLACYRRSRLFQLIAFALWTMSRVLPIRLLGAILRSCSRHPR